MTEILLRFIVKQLYTAGYSNLDLQIRTEAKSFLTLFVVLYWSCMCTIVVGKVLYFKKLKGFR